MRMYQRQVEMKRRVHILDLAIRNVSDYRCCGSIRTCIGPARETRAVDKYPGFCRVSYPYQRLRCLGWPAGRDGYSGHSGRLKWGDDRQRRRRTDGLSHLHGHGVRNAKVRSSEKAAMRSRMAAPPRRLLRWSFMSFLHVIASIDAGDFIINELTR